MSRGILNHLCVRVTHNFDLGVGTSSISKGSYTGYIQILDIFYTQDREFANTTVPVRYLQILQIASAPILVLTKLFM